MTYKRFFAMIATSVVVMFCLMYLNSYQILDHAWFSETRAFMALIMGGAMMIVMLAFMLKMYENRAANLAIFVGGALLILAAVALVRSQVTVSGGDYMEGMIPCDLDPESAPGSKTRECRVSPARSSKRSAARSARWSG